MEIKRILHTDAIIMIPSKVKTLAALVRLVVLAPQYAHQRTNAPVIVHKLGSDRQVGVMIPSNIDLLHPFQYGLTIRINIGSICKNNDKD